MFTAFVTPYRITFVDVDTLGWELVDYAIDLIFTIDIFFNFFTAYFDDEENIILNRKLIAKAYLKSWFFVDLISVLPVSFFFRMQKDYTSLARIARLPRLYRLLKMTK